MSSSPRLTPIEITGRVVCLALIASAVLFQNCGEFRSLKSGILNGASVADDTSTIVSAVLQPATDKTDASCMTNSKYDACLFAKNPVAVQNASFSGSASASANLDGLQVYGVKLTGLTGNGRLSNSTLSVESLTGTPVTVGATNLRTSARTDSAHVIAQTMAYYWLNRTGEYLYARTGIYPARDKQIKVYADDTIAGWSPDTNSIHLKLSDNGDAMAWSAELAIHFLGVANLYHATNGAIRENISTRHKNCGLKAAGCCTSVSGCSRAIASGVGDYFAAVIFPDRPVVGETWANRTQGLGFCNISRNLNDARTLTASSVFNACASAGISGEVSTMGTVYASIWWELRKAAAAERPVRGDADIDKLFMSHLAVLKGDDTFPSAYAKIMDLDETLFGGRYADLITSKFNGRL